MTSVNSASNEVEKQEAKVCQCESEMAGAWWSMTVVFPPGWGQERDGLPGSQLNEPAGF